MYLYQDEHFWQEHTRGRWIFMKIIKWLYFDGYVCEVGDMFEWCTMFYIHVSKQTSHNDSSLLAKIHCLPRVKHTLTRDVNYLLRVSHMLTGDVHCLLRVNHTLIVDLHWLMRVKHTLTRDLHCLLRVKHTLTGMYTGSWGLNIH